MGYGRSAVAEMHEDLKKVQIVTDAIELLEDGYPLDSETKKQLGEVGINYVEFTRRFQIQTSD